MPKKSQFKYICIWCDETKPEARFQRRFLSKGVPLCLECFVPSEFNRKKRYRDCRMCNKRKSVKDFTSWNTYSSKYGPVCRGCKEISKLVTPLLNDIGMKYCKRGDHILDKDRFYLSSSGQLRSDCIDCVSKSVKTKDDIGEIRGAKTLKLHNLTPEKYNQMLIDQKYKCYLCPAKLEDLTRGLVIDHNHKCCPGKYSCGKCIRGLLCHNCNMGLGSLGDDPVRLRASADYVELFE